MMLDRVREIERRARREDLLVGDEARARFFEARIPEEVASGRGFRRWHGALGSPERLCFSLDDLVRPGSRLPDAEEFPDEIDVSGVPVTLAYRFAPGEPDDGITARIASTVLGVVDARAFEWLVPGHREEKAIALLRTLPRPLRRRIAPLRDTARRCLAWTHLPAGGFAAGLGAALREVAGIEVDVADFRPDRIPLPLHMRFEVFDTEGELLGSGRDLAELKARFQSAAARSFAQAAAEVFERDGLTAWSFDDLPDHVDAMHAGVRFRGYPALEDRGRSVALRLFDAPGRAAAVHPRGVHRLAMLRLGRELRSVRRALGRTDRLALRYLSAPASPWIDPGPAGAGSPPELGEELLARAVVECCLEDGADVQARDEFERRIADGAGRLESVALALRDLADRILAAREGVRAARAALEARSYPESLADFDEQLAFLVYRGFIADTPLGRLEEIPRYLDAARRRIEKLPRNPVRDLESTRTVRALWTPVRDELLALRDSAERDDPARGRSRWMIEELRVSLFVQEMGTRYPVSVKRVERAWESRLTAPPEPALDPAAPRRPRAQAKGTDSGSSPGDRAPG